MAYTRHAPGPVHPAHYSALLHTRFTPEWLVRFALPPVYETMPCDFPNTKWVCQEEDFFFIVDRHGESRGETTVDGEPMFFSLDFAPSLSRPSRIFAFVLPYAKNWPEIWRAHYTEPDPFFKGRFDCQPDRCQIITPATSLFSLAKEARTLHFVREDLDEEVDFYGPYCSICKGKREGG